MSREHLRFFTAQSLLLLMQATGFGNIRVGVLDEVAPEDQMFEQHGVKLLIDPKSLAYIDGTELDYVREGLNEGFKFNNPNERDRCGCGESFRV